MRTNKIISFQGKQYILAERQEFLSGSKDIYEPEELKAGRRSYAIVNAEGEIWRHHQLIGTMSDVEILPGEDHTELEASPLEVANPLFLARCSFYRARRCWTSKSR